MRQNSSFIMFLIYEQKHMTRFKVFNRKWPLFQHFLLHFPILTQTVKLYD